jgi:UDP-N-acetylmuramyl tripeptide synthase
VSGLGQRQRGAVAATRGVNWVSRRLRLGGGTVVGGRVGLRLAPDLLAELTAGRPVALVTGTNGKTTTTRLLAAALETAGTPVVTNATGSNMPPGHVAALAEGPPGSPVVLEVDEAYLPAVVTATAPRTVSLLNLSRDQLDRSNEVRMVAARWRAVLEGCAAVVVANADDPLVVFGAERAPQVVWVAGGQRWRADATGCPACGGRISFEPGRWWCPCGFARPVPQVSAEVGEDGSVVAVLEGGGRLPVDLRIPGEFNRRNAVVAMAAARVLGIDPAGALAAMAQVEEVAGRFSLHRVDGVSVRLLLAKNPAGWVELLALVGPTRGPVVVGINARIADGRDPSWLWDVPFERLAGRPVVATGERSADLSVRLHYAGVAHERVPEPRLAVLRAAALDRDTAAVDFVGNYTAFFDLLRQLPVA